MVHLVFDRPASQIKAFGGGILRYTFAASGDAWGNYSNGVRTVQYGHDGSISPGHYKLTRVERIDPPIASEGAGQIYVADMTGSDYFKLAQGGKVKAIAAARWSIGGIELPVGMLGHFGRAEIMAHGGGSNAPDPFAAFQELCRTYGCTRLHNADLATLMDYLEPLLAAANQFVIFSVIGDPPELPL
jgi:hypothetical protein